MKFLFVSTTVSAVDLPFNFSDNTAALPIAVFSFFFDLESFVKLSFILRITNSMVLMHGFFHL
ncbi:MULTISPECIES: hypothetical protein [Sediminibacillus]|uniref:hypothetical protein n=1 Tax=Sediminibacillus TaxID=482460 RepID=UPI001294D802|nr:hypothetical protein [Sediminibacillus terrae]